MASCVMDRPFFLYECMYTCPHLHFRGFVTLTSMSAIVTCPHSIMSLKIGQLVVVATVDKLFRIKVSSSMLDIATPPFPRPKKRPVSQKTPIKRPTNPTKPPKFQ